MGTKVPKRSDAELLARMAEGKEEAFEALLRRYEKRVYSRFFRIFRSPEEAADLTQQAFLVLIRKAEAFQADKGSVGALLFGMVRILALKRLRELRRHPVPADPAAVGATPGPLEEALRRERQEAVLRGIGRLAPIRRRMILLKEVEGLSITKIAREAGIPESTVKSHLRRARIELRRWLRPHRLRGEDE